jgi:hypothetical protein
LVSACSREIPQHLVSFDEIPIAVQKAFLENHIRPNVVQVTRVGINEPEALYAIEYWPSLSEMNKVLVFDRNGGLATNQQLHLTGHAR